MIGIIIDMNVAYLVRRIERVHALVKRQGAHKFGIELPYLCALVREPGSLQRVKDDADFKQFCKKTWDARNVLDRLLHHRFGKAELKEMSHKHKLGLVYQCSAEFEYLDISDSRVAQDFFVNETALSRAGPIAVTDRVRHCVEFRDDRCISIISSWRNE